MAFITQMAFPDLVKFSKEGFHRRMEEPAMHLHGGGYRVSNSIARYRNDYYDKYRDPGCPTLDDKLNAIPKKVVKVGFSNLNILTMKCLQEFIANEWK